MIATNTFLIAAFLSITWGIYLIGTIRIYREVRTTPRMRSDIIVAMRRFVVAFCLWLFIFSFVFRTACVLLGIGEDIAGQIVFFTLLGTNVAGSIFCVVSLKYD